MVKAFPFLLLRLPSVPRSALHALAYRHDRDDADASSADTATVALLQSQPFFGALEEANGELAARVAKLPRVAAKEMKKKERQTVRAALRYLWRAALRPVPCGRLCGTALGVLEVAGARPLDLRQREIAPSASPPRIPEVIPLSAVRRCRVYLDPSVRVDDADEPFRMLATILDGVHSIAWSELVSRGFAEKDLLAAIHAGIAGLGAAAPGEEEVDAWMRVWWEAVPHDFSVLDTIATLEAAPGPRVDSCCARLLPVSDDGISDFLAEVADHGSRIAYEVSPANFVASRLLPPDGRPMFLRELYERYVQAVPTTAPSALEEMRRSSRRLSVRFRRATNGPHGPRYHVIFFGGSRMSLLPRYATLPFAADFAAEVRHWMSRWPELCDLFGVIAHDADTHAPFTRRVIHCAGPPPATSRIRLADLRVVLRPGSVAPLLIDPEDNPVQPVFFGVAAEYALPPLVRFALMLGQPERTALEVICEQLGHLLAQRLAGCGDAIVSLPERTLGRSIVLQPQLHLVPAAALPRIGTPVTRHDFRAVHDWLRQFSLPTELVQCGAPGEEPQWLDFRHPEGVNNFFRMTRSRPLLIVAGSFLDRDDHGFRAIEGWYEPEYYAEVTYEPCRSIPMPGARSSSFTPSG
jgi:hypothetical protein